VEHDHLVLDAGQRRQGPQIIEDITGRLEIPEQEIRLGECT